MFASTSLVVLGIDPGLTRCGYAALAPSSGGSVEAISMGVLTSPKEDSLPRRLALLQCDLEALISEVKPSAIAVEQVFFPKQRTHCHECRTGKRFSARARIQTRH